MVSQTRLIGSAFLVFGSSLIIEQAETQLIENFLEIANVLNIVLTIFGLLIILMSIFLITMPMRFEEQIRTTKRGTILIWACVIAFSLTVLVK